MAESLDLEHFSASRGTRFRVLPESSDAFELELYEVQSLRPSGARVRPGAAPRREPFSLLFRGPMQPLLPQRIYAFEHETMGSFEMFIVPIGPDDLGLRYEAIFT